jgi:hypothetical protein
MDTVPISSVVNLQPHQALPTYRLAALMRSTIPPSDWRSYTFVSAKTIDNGVIVELSRYSYITKGLNKGSLNYAVQGRIQVFVTNEDREAAAKMLSAGYVTP